MDFDQLMSKLETSERTKYQSLVSQFQSGGSQERKIKGQFAQLVIKVQKRLNQKPNPSSIVAQFVERYAVKRDQCKLSKPVELLPASSYPQALAIPLSVYQNTQDSASSHKALLDLGEAILVYVTGIQFGEYRQDWELDESIETEFYRNAKRKPSFGVFLSFLRRLANADGTSILDHVFQKNAQFPAVSEYVLIYDLLGCVINQGQDDNFQDQVKQLKKGRTVPKCGVLNFYDTFISMRNAYAHPEDKAKNPLRKWPLGPEYYTFVNPYTQAAVEELIANLSVVTQYKPFTVEEIDANAGQSKILIEVGLKVIDGQIPLKANHILKTNLRYLMDLEGEPFTQFYYNEIPQLDTTVAKKIISQEKAKILEPVLKGMINQYLSNDDEIDQDEYLTLKLTAQSADIRDQELKQIISQTRKENHLPEKFEIISSTPRQKPEITFNPWWVHYFTYRQGFLQVADDTRLSSVRSGMADQEGTPEFYHRYVWSQIHSYLQEKIDQELNQPNERWLLQPNGWQQGRYSGYFWGKIYPEQSPIGSALSISHFVKEKPTRPDVWPESAYWNKNLYQIDCKSGTHIRIEPDFDRLAPIYSNQDPNLGLFYKISKINTDFLVNNRGELDRYDIWVALIDLRLIKKFKGKDRITDALIYADLKKHDNLLLVSLDTYFEKYHQEEDESIYVQRIIISPSVLDSNEIDTTIKFSLRLSASIISKITDFALEKGLNLMESQRLEKVYQQQKMDLLEGLRSQIENRIFDQALSTESYEELLDLVLASGLRIIDFLDLKKEYQKKGIDFQDGQFIDRASDELIEWMDQQLDQLKARSLSVIDRILDTGKKRLRDLGSKRFYGFSWQSGQIIGHIGFRLRNTGKICAALQIEGNRENSGQIDDFMQWVGSHPQWFSYYADGSPRFHLHTGRKTFTIERHSSFFSVVTLFDNDASILELMSGMLSDFFQSNPNYPVEKSQ